MHLFELLSQTDTFGLVTIIFDQKLVDLSQFNTTFDGIDFDVTFVQLTALLPDGPLITSDELIGLHLLSLAR